MASHLARALRPSPPSSSASATAAASVAAALLSSTSPLPAARFLELHAHLLRTDLLPLAPTASASAFLSLAAASLPSPRALSVLLHHLTPESLPSTFRCNSILSSLHEPDALRFLRRARALGRRGNAFSLSIVLKHCRTLAHARQLHANVVAEGHSRDALLATSLVRSYAACGDGDAARRMFDEMPVKDTVAWNVLITCYIRNRRTKDALKLFDEMRGGENGAEPDEVTCILILQACTSLGALDFGEQVWEYAEDHGYGDELKLMPNVHHYGCMVDLMGRAGLLDQAYELVVKDMRVAPDATIWRTLLAVEDWEKVAEVRKLMKEKGIQTTPGCTTVELNGEIHEFIAADDSHPRKEEIYEKLDEINKHLRIAGYVPNVSSELHDLDSEGKECALAYHSEKLAIAFALLVMPQHRPIRLAKNLRVCVDCHNFTKHRFDERKMHEANVTSDKRLGFSG
ncbi:hypothetical protein E2562_026827 [Oryza meyeriana var. granulata]|uniref:DYW domain-containing protein n=1 Tax=Oryza meyeriana var. granulata TaxID=110450 RepID=A0A6G1CJZ8_9ORYZ|nr:hypothetical protein E2562_026827 [Oryza meyeriana var. granulata]